VGFLGGRGFEVFHFSELKFVIFGEKMPLFFQILKNRITRLPDFYKKFQR
jgi:hypothetical protein